MLIEVLLRHLRLCAEKRVDRDLESQELFDGLLRRSRVYSDQIVVPWSARSSGTRVQFFGVKVFDSQLL